MSLHEADLEHYPRKFGKYHLLGPLAQGGMGALYLAVTGDRGLERLMVIKTVLPHLADAEYVARFRDEAKVVVKLSHGNLIPVFDAGLVAGELFLAMDFVEGRDLRAVWNRCAKKQVAFPIDVAVYIVKELCRGLGYAHSFPDLNLVHRDVSPPNVLVSYTGEVKLTDFGLASSTLKLEKTAPGIIYGKVAYMSPEQARGEVLDGRSDMYATGIVLWELLTGRQLFPPGKDQPQDLLSRAKNPEPMRPSKRAPRVPVDLDDICLRALASNKEDRYATCDDMREALQGWLAKNAPTTDGTRMATFLADLFNDDIGRERAERQELISRVRTRALTLPPSDELRQWIEKSAKIQTGEATDDGELTEDGVPPVRRPNSVGRRSTDRNEEGWDRRQSLDRRLMMGRASSPAIGATALATQAQDDEAETDLVGMEVDGRYRVMELIGEGGMGKVYLAEHIEIGKRVALKVLHQSYSRMPDLVERFRREARAASKIGHPNIVDVTDSGTTNDGSVYFVMEYLEGVELGSVIEREGALDVARALRITGQICRALAAAHREGIIHRDLKPENIFLITRDGTADIVKVLDFGIAKTMEAEAARERKLTSPGMAMGTPEYMAPEQAAGRPADARTDVYALGAIMYEMTTGSPPYSGDNFMEILTKKATVDPPPPLTIRPELAPQVGDLVMASMSRNPDDRPQTMEALEYELNKCLSGRGVAVAQILGMTTDANVMQSLNPGLSVRTIDEGIVLPRSATSPSIIGRFGTQSNAELLPPIGPTGVTQMPQISTSGRLIAPRSTTEPSSAQSTSLRAQTAPVVGEPVSARSAPPAAQEEKFENRDGYAYVRGHYEWENGQYVWKPAAPVATTSAASLSVDVITSGSVGSPAVRRSGFGIFGWLLLAAILFGGVGALLYVALGERGAHAKDPLPSVDDPGALDGSDGSALVAQPDAPSAGMIVDGSGSGSGGSDVVDPNPAKEPTKDLKVDPKIDPKTGKAIKPPIKTGLKPQTEPKDAKGLYELALAAEQSGDNEAILAAFKKVEKFKPYAAEAVYKQAMAAMQLNRIEDAQALAARGFKGSYATPSRILYGDTFFK
ncbi:MAG: serine/threonine-protein kinase [Proteobacteria bacterium]|nr:serine/threonine-protein kinase [Pseudomonadota bacterium]